MIAGIIPFDSDHPAASNTRHYRVTRYRLTVFAVLTSTALVAFGTAIAWPIHGKQIQASFFLSLAASSLTVFGLVFTLCLIGTQLVATRTNITVARIFGAITWLYLGFFLMTTLWTLATSYYAGNPNPSPVICRSLDSYRICMSEVRAGRISIFCLAWSLLLLLPFIIYIYLRLSPRYAFSTLVGKVLRARDEESLRRRCRRVTDEVISVASDTRAAAEGLSQLLELSMIGARRKDPKGQVTADDLAEVLSEELANLNYSLVQQSPISGLVLVTFQQWTLWLIHGAQRPGRTPVGLHSVSPQQVGRTARIAVRSATRNLRLWENSSGADSSARETTNLIQGIVEACETSKVPIRVRISEAAIQLAECAAIKQVDGPRADFNLAIRSLIKLCELTSKERILYLGGKVVLRETTRALKGLGEVNAGRDQLSSWVLDELHNLTDRLSLVMPSLWPEGWENYLATLTLLKDNEIKEILSGPGLPKRHTLKRAVSHSWGAVVIGQLYAAGRSDALALSLASAVGRCATDSDLPGLVALFEQLAIEYSDNIDFEIRPLLTISTDNIRSCFSKNVSLRRRSLDKQQGLSTLTEPGTPRPSDCRAGWGTK